MEYMYLTKSQELWHSSFFIILVLLDEFNKIKFTKKSIDLTRDWTKLTFLAISQSNHYTRMFSVLVWGLNWIWFIHVWFCPIRLIQLIGRKSVSNVHVALLFNHPWFMSELYQYVSVAILMKYFSPLPVMPRT